MDSLHTTPRLYVPDTSLTQGARVEVAVDQAHYLVHVLRAHEGDVVRVFNEDSGEWRGDVALGGKKRGAAVVMTAQLRTPQAEGDLTLYCAPIKKAHFDFMVMTATELGVTGIQPVLTARTQVREINIARLQAIAVEAAEQSERLSVPRIFPTLTMAALTDAWPDGKIPIVCAEFGAARPVGEALRELAGALPSSIGILTGPEGGFTPEEMTRIQNLPQAVSVRLGPRILRADTAALAALSCWQAVGGDWR